MVLPSRGKEGRQGEGRKRGNGAGGEGKRPGQKRAAESMKPKGLQGN